MVYKLLSILLGVSLLVCGGFYCYERYQKNKLEQELNNQIADLSNTLRDTQTAYSRVAQQIKDIKVQNEELQDIIEDRNEEILSLNEVVLKWKNLYFEILDASGGVTDSDGNPSSLDPDCKKCLKDKQIRVDFDQTKDYLRVYGNTIYTLESSKAFVNLEWIRDLKLQMILTRNKNNNYRVYIDVENSDVVPTNIELKVDPSLYSVKWYERLGFGSSLGVGDGLMVSANVYVQIFNNIIIGPSFMSTFNGKDISKFYGITGGYFPWR